MQLNFKLPKTISTKHNIIEISVFTVQIAYFTNLLTLQNAR